MAEQDFLNYASDDGGNVSVPRRLRTRPDSSEVELAYITPEEAGILSTLRPGSPHRGPMEVPSYDDYDVSTGTYRSGAAMSAAESSGPQNERMRADLRQAGISPQEARAIRSGAAAAAGMGQRDGGNFLGNIGGGIRNIGGGIRNIFGNIGNKLGAWAGKMRGGINPATNTWYTQDEYEQNVQDRRDRASMDRIGRTREKYYANDPRGWEASDLSGRLEGLEKQFGIDQPVDARGLFEQEQRGIGATNVAQDLGAPFGMEKENMLREMINNSYDRNVTSLPVDDDVMQRFTFADMGIDTNAANNLNNQMAKVYDKNALIGAGAKSGFFGANDELEAMENYFQEAQGLREGKLGKGKTPGQLRTWMERQQDIPFGGGLKSRDINMDLVPEDFLENEQDFIKQYSPYTLFGKAQGGRVGYNTGGRVGILAAF